MGLHVAHRASPEAMADLEDPEQIIIWAFRRWILGLSTNSACHWSMVWNDFARRFGAQEAKTAMVGLAGMVKELHLNARHRIRHHAPCCPCVGPDELAFAGFIGACQRGEWTLAHAQAEWLVRPDGIGGLLESGVLLAKTLAEHGLMVPDRALSPQPVLN